MGTTEVKKSTEGRKQAKQKIALIKLRTGSHQSSLNPGGRNGGLEEPADGKMRSRNRREQRAMIVR